VVLLEAEMARKAKRTDVAKERYEKFLSLGADDLLARLGLAQIALDGSDSAEAIRQYEAAKACFPRYVGPGNPYLALSRLHTAAGEVEKAVKEMEAYARIAPEDFSVRRRLASHYRRTKDDAGLLRVCAEMVDIHPFGAERGDPPDMDLHRDYADALARAGRKDEALRERKVQTLLVGLLPEPERKKAGGVEAHLAYGEALLEAGRDDEAFEEALAALSIDPSSVAARALKERADAKGALR
jgi:tetratricopeptide (TPR) repeat protein